MQCPCHSNKPYNQCCKPLHDGKPAENAKALMRSRYSAYALCLPDYIIETTHPENPAHQHNKKQWRSELIAFSKQTKYESLEIRAFTENVKEASVTFHAGLSQNGQDLSFTEKSRFKQENGKWFYANGIFET